MKNPSPRHSRPPVWVLVLAAAVYAAWLFLLGTLAVLHNLV